MLNEYQNKMMTSPCNKQMEKKKKKYKKPIISLSTSTKDINDECGQKKKGFLFKKFVPIGKEVV